MENVMTSSDQKDVPKEQPKKEVKKTAGKNWKNDDEEEEEPEPPVVVEPEKKKNIDIQVLTSPDEDYLKQVNENSLVPGIHLALGNFQKAINLLKSQIRLANFEQLKPIMRNVYLANKAQFKFIPCLQNNIFHIRDSRSGKMVPSGAVTLTAINAKLNKAFDLGTSEEALLIFREILGMALFFVASSKEEEQSIREIINVCSEYCYLIRMNQHKEKVKSDKVKNAEISCLMTLCKLEQPIHYYFIYNKAKIACKNIKNYMTAVYFLKKILALEKELEGAEDIDFEKVKQEFVTCQNQGTNAQQLTFNITENFPNARNNIDGINFNLVKEKSTIKCPLCSASYFHDASNSICANCNLSVLGQEFLGLKFTADF